MTTQIPSTSRMQITMSKPDISIAEIEAVMKVMNTPTLSIGPRIVEFESGFVTKLGVKHAIGVSSGTAGLHMGVIAAKGEPLSGLFEQGPLNAVITTPFSFVSSSNVALYENAVPIFVDVDPRTCNIDVQLVCAAADDLFKGGKSAERWIPRALRSRAAAAGIQVRAILPVHAFGQPADMDPILAAATKYGVAVIEDACEAIGAEYKGKKAGTLGDCGVFAFYPNKQMTTGEGGMIVTNRDDWDALFRSLRNQGRDVFDAWLTHSRLGYNYRLDEISAALGFAQLRRLDELLEKRSRVAAWYNERLKNFDPVRVPHIAESTTRMSWFVYVVRLAERVDRDRLVGALDEHGVPSRPYFTPIHLQPFYRRLFDYRAGDYPVTEALGNSCLALPFSGVMTESEVDYVCETLAKVLGL